MMAVLSAGKRIAARKADRGTMSIDAVHDRKMSSTSDQWTSFGRGRRARQIEDGRCVNTMVYGYIVLVKRRQNGPR
jgi:hypothetical protein